MDAQDKLSAARLALIVHQGVKIAKGRRVDCISRQARVWVYAYLVLSRRPL